MDAQPIAAKVPPANSSRQRSVLFCATLNAHSLANCHGGCCVSAGSGVAQRRARRCSHGAFGGLMGQKFFISFKSADRTKAQLIPWAPKKAGHKGSVHHWEISPGRHTPPSLHTQ